MYTFTGFYSKAIKMMAQRNKERNPYVNLKQIYQTHRIWLNRIDQNGKKTEWDQLVHSFKYI